MGGRKIKWTPRGIKEKEAILNYWYFRNKSLIYPIKINGLLNETIVITSDNPEIGRVFDEKRKIRFVLLKTYRIYYTWSENEFIVLSLWDTRRNFSEFNL